jgi:hypothetical protein
MLNEADDRPRLDLCYVRVTAVLQHDGNSLGIVDNNCVAPTITEFPIIVGGDYVEYTWDYRNRLTLVTFKNSSHTATKIVAYEYDIFDRRVRKRVDETANSSWDRGEQYVYDGAHIALVFDDAGDLARRNLFGPAVDQILASEFVDSPNVTHWYLGDHLGTIRDIYSYNPTGNVLSWFSVN